LKLSFNWFKNSRKLYTTRHENGAGVTPLLSAAAAAPIRHDTMTGGTWRRQENGGGGRAHLF